MAKSKANTRNTTARSGDAKGSESVASAPTAGAGLTPEELAALHADPLLVLSAGIRCGMSRDEIDARLIEAHAARSAA